MSDISMPSWTEISVGSFSISSPYFNSRMIVRNFRLVCPLLARSPILLSADSILVSLSLTRIERPKTVLPIRAYPGDAWSGHHLGWCINRFGKRPGKAIAPVLMKTAQVTRYINQLAAMIYDVTLLVASYAGLWLLRLLVSIVAADFLTARDVLVRVKALTVDVSAATDSSHVAAPTIRAAVRASARVRIPAGALLAIPVLPTRCDVAVGLTLAAAVVGCNASSQITDIAPFCDIRGGFCATLIDFAPTFTDVRVEHARAEVTPTLVDAAALLVGAVGASGTVRIARTAPTSDSCATSPPCAHCDPLVLTGSPPSADPRIPTWRTPLTAAVGATVSVDAAALCIRSDADVTSGRALSVVARASGLRVSVTTQASLAAEARVSAGIVATTVAVSQAHCMQWINGGTPDSIDGTTTSDVAVVSAEAVGVAVAAPLVDVTARTCEVAVTPMALAAVEALVVTYANRARRITSLVAPFVPSSPTPTAVCEGCASSLWRGAAAASAPRRPHIRGVRAAASTVTVSVEAHVTDVLAATAAVRAASVAPGGPLHDLGFRERVAPAAPTCAATDHVRPCGAGASPFGPEAAVPALPPTSVRLTAYVTGVEVAMAAPCVVCGCGSVGSCLSGAHTAITWDGVLGAPIAHVRARTVDVGIDHNALYAAPASPTSPPNPSARAEPDGRDVSLCGAPVGATTPPRPHCVVPLATLPDGIALAITAQTAALGLGLVVPPIRRSRCDAPPVAPSATRVPTPTPYVVDVTAAYAGARIEVATLDAILALHLVVEWRLHRIFAALAAAPTDASASAAALTRARRSQSVRARGALAGAGGSGWSEAADADEPLVTVVLRPRAVRAALPFESWWCGDDRARCIVTGEAPRGTDQLPPPSAAVAALTSARVNDVSVRGLVACLASPTIAIAIYPPPMTLHQRHGAGILRAGVSMSDFGLAVTAPPRTPIAVFEGASHSDVSRPSVVPFVPTRRVGAQRSAFGPADPVAVTVAANRLVSLPAGDTASAIVVVAGSSCAPLQFRQTDTGDGWSELFVAPCAVPQHFAVLVSIGSAHARVDYAMSDTLMGMLGVISPYTSPSFPQCGCTNATPASAIHRDPALPLLPGCAAYVSAAAGVLVAVAVEDSVAGSLPTVIPPLEAAGAQFAPFVSAAIHGRRRARARRAPACAMASSSDSDASGEREPAHMFTRPSSARVAAIAARASAPQPLLLSPADDYNVAIVPAGELHAAVAVLVTVDTCAADVTVMTQGVALYDDRPCVSGRVLLQPIPADDIGTATSPSVQLRVASRNCVSVPARDRHTVISLGLHSHAIWVHTPTYLTMLSAIIDRGDVAAPLGKCGAALPTLAATPCPSLVLNFVRYVAPWALAGAPVAPMPSVMPQWSVECTNVHAAVAPAHRAGTQLHAVLRAAPAAAPFGSGADGCDPAAFVHDTVVARAQRVRIGGVLVDAAGTAARATRPDGAAAFSVLAPCPTAAPFDAFLCALPRAVADAAAAGYARYACSATAVSCRGAVIAADDVGIDLVTVGHTWRDMAAARSFVPVGNTPAALRGSLGGAHLALPSTAARHGAVRIMAPMDATIEVALGVPHLAPWETAQWLRAPSVPGSRPAAAGVPAFPIDATADRVWQRRCASVDPGSDLTFVARTTTPVVLRIPDTPAYLALAQAAAAPMGGAAGTLLAAAAEALPLAPSTRFGLSAYVDFAAGVQVALGATCGDFATANDLIGATVRHDGYVTSVAGRVALVTVPTATAAGGAASARATFVDVAVDAVAIHTIVPMPSGDAFATETPERLTPVMMTAVPTPGIAARVATDAHPAAPYAARWPPANAQDATATLSRFLAASPTPPAPPVAALRFGMIAESESWYDAGGAGTLSADATYVASLVDAAPLLRSFGVIAHAPLIARSDLAAMLEVISGRLLTDAVSAAAPDLLGLSALCTDSVPPMTMAVHVADAVVLPPLADAARRAPEMTIRPYPAAKGTTIPILDALRNAIAGGGQLAHGGLIGQAAGCQSCFSVHAPLALVPVVRGADMYVNVVLQPILAVGAPPPEALAAYGAVGPAVVAAVRARAASASVASTRMRFHERLARRVLGGHGDPSAAAGVVDGTHTIRSMASTATVLARAIVGYALPVDTGLAACLADMHVHRRRVAPRGEAAGHSGPAAGAAPQRGRFPPPPLHATQQASVFSRRFVDITPTSLEVAASPLPATAPVWARRDALGLQLRCSAVRGLSVTLGRVVIAADPQVIVCIPLWSRLLGASLASVRPSSVAVAVMARSGGPPPRAVRVDARLASACGAIDALSGVAPHNVPSFHTLAYEPGILPPLPSARVTMAACHIVLIATAPEVATCAASAAVTPTGSPFSTPTVGRCAPIPGPHRGGAAGLLAVPPTFPEQSGCLAAPAAPTQPHLRWRAVSLTIDTPSAVVLPLGAAGTFLGHAPRNEGRVLPSDSPSSGATVDVPNLGLAARVRAPRACIVVLETPCAAAQRAASAAAGAGDLDASLCSSHVIDASVNATIGVMSGSVRDVHFDVFNGPRTTAPVGAHSAGVATYITDPLSLAISAVPAPQSILDALHAIRPRPKRRARDGAVTTGDGVSIRVAVPPVALALTTAECVTLHVVAADMLSAWNTNAVLTFAPAQLSGVPILDALLDEARALEAVRRGLGVVVRAPRLALLIVPTPPGASHSDLTVASTATRASPTTAGSSRRAKAPPSGPDALHVLVEGVALRVTPFGRRGDFSVAGLRVCCDAFVSAPDTACDDVVSASPRHACRGAFYASPTVAARDMIRAIPAPSSRGSAQGVSGPMASFTTGSPTPAASRMLTVGWVYNSGAQLTVAARVAPAITIESRSAATAAALYATVVHASHVVPSLREQVVSGSTALHRFPSTLTSFSGAVPATLTGPGGTTVSPEAAVPYVNATSLHQQPTMVTVCASMALTAPILLHPRCILHICGAHTNTVVISAAVVPGVPQPTVTFTHWDFTSAAPRPHQPLIVVDPGVTLVLRGITFSCDPEAVASVPSSSFVRLDACRVDSSIALTSRPLANPVAVPELNLSPSSVPLSSSFQRSFTGSRSQSPTASNASPNAANFLSSTQQRRIMAAPPPPPARVRVATVQLELPMLVRVIADAHGTQRASTGPRTSLQSPSPPVELRTAASVVVDGTVGHVPGTGLLPALRTSVSGLSVSLHEPHPSRHGSSRMTHSRDSVAELCNAVALNLSIAPCALRTSRPSPAIGLAIVDLVSPIALRISARDMRNLARLTRTAAVTQKTVLRLLHTLQQPVLTRSHVHPAHTCAALPSYAPDASLAMSRSVPCTLPAPVADTAPASALLESMTPASAVDMAAMLTQLRNGPLLSDGPSSPDGAPPPSSSGRSRIALDEVVVVLVPPRDSPEVAASSPAVGLLARPALRALVESITHPVARPARRGGQEEPDALLSVALVDDPTSSVAAWVRVRVLAASAAGVWCLSRRTPRPAGTSVGLNGSFSALSAVSDGGTGQSTVAGPEASASAARMGADAPARLALAVETSASAWITVDTYSAAFSEWEPLVEPCNITATATSADAAALLRQGLDDFDATDASTDASVPLPGVLPLAAPALTALSPGAIPSLGAASARSSVAESITAPDHAYRASLTAPGTLTSRAVRFAVDVAAPQADTPAPVRDPPPTFAGHTVSLTTSVVDINVTYPIALALAKVHAAMVAAAPAAPQAAAGNGPVAHTAMSSGVRRRFFKFPPAGSQEDRVVQTCGPGVAPDSGFLQCDVANMTGAHLALAPAIADGWGPSAAAVAGRVHRGLSDAEQGGLEAVDVVVVPPEAHGVLDSDAAATGVTLALPKGLGVVLSQLRIDVFAPADTVLDVESDDNLSPSPAHMLRSSVLPSGETLWPPGSSSAGAQSAQMSAHAGSPNGVGPTAGRPAHAFHLGSAELRAGYAPLMLRGIPLLARVALDGARRTLTVSTRVIFSNLTAVPLVIDGAGIVCPPSTRALQEDAVTLAPCHGAASAASFETVMASVSPSHGRVSIPVLSLLAPISLRVAPPSTVAPWLGHVDPFLTDVSLPASVGFTYGDAYRYHQLATVVRFDTHATRSALHAPSVSHSIANLTRSVANMTHSVTSMSRSNANIGPGHAVDGGARSGDAQLPMYGVLSVATDAAASFATVVTLAAPLVIHNLTGLAIAVEALQRPYPGGPQRGGKDGAVTDSLYIPHKCSAATLHAHPDHDISLRVALCQPGGATAAATTIRMGAAATAGERGACVSKPFLAYDAAWVSAFTTGVARALSSKVPTIIELTDGDDLKLALAVEVSTTPPGFAAATGSEAQYQPSRAAAHSAAPVHVVLSCRYWVRNDTEHAVRAVWHTNRSRLTAGQAASLGIPPRTDEPFLLCPVVDDSLEASIYVALGAATGWSERIPIAHVGFEDAVTCELPAHKGFAKCATVAVSFSECPLVGARTRVVTMAPRWLVRNNSTTRLAVGQVPAGDLLAPTDEAVACVAVVCPGPPMLLDTVHLRRSTVLGGVSRRALAKEAFTLSLRHVAVGARGVTTAGPWSLPLDVSAAEDVHVAVQMPYVSPLAGVAVPTADDQVAAAVAANPPHTRTGIVRVSIFRPIDSHTTEVWLDDVDSAPYVLENRTSVNTVVWQVASDRTRTPVIPYLAPPHRSTDFALPVPCSRSVAVKVAFIIGRPASTTQGSTLNKTLARYVTGGSAASALVSAMGDTAGPTKDVRTLDRYHSVTVPLSGDASGRTAGHQVVIGGHTYKVVPHYRAGPLGTQCVITITDDADIARDLIASRTLAARQAFQMKCSMRGLGVAFLETAGGSPIRELLYASVRGLRFDVSRSENTISVSASVGAMQVDDMRANSLYPIVMASDPHLTQDARGEAATSRFIDMSAVLSTDAQLGSDVRVYSAMMDAAPVEVKLEDSFIFALLHAARPFLAFRGHSDRNTRSSLSAIGSSTSIVSAAAAAAAVATAPIPQRAAARDGVGAAVVLLDQLSVSPVELVVSIVRHRRPSEDPYPSIIGPLAVVVRSLHAHHIALSAYRPDPTTARAWLHALRAAMYIRGELRDNWMSLASAMATSSGAAPQRTVRNGAVKARIRPPRLLVAGAPLRVYSPAPLRHSAVAVRETVRDADAMADEVTAAAAGWGHGLVMASHLELPGHSLRFPPPAAPACRCSLVSKLRKKQPLHAVLTAAAEAHGQTVPSQRSSKGATSDTTVTVREVAMHATLSDLLVDVPTWAVGVREAAVAFRDAHIGELISVKAADVAAVACTRCDAVVSLIHSCIAGAPFDRDLAVSWTDRDRARTHALGADLWAGVVTDTATAALSTVNKTLAEPGERLRDACRSAVDAADDGHVAGLEWGQIAALSADRQALRSAPIAAALMDGLRPLSWQIAELRAAVSVGTLLPHELAHHLPLPLLVRILTPAEFVDALPTAFGAISECAAGVVTVWDRVHL